MSGKQSSFYRIDEQVVYTLIAVCIISITIFAFRLARDKPCTSVSMSFGSDSIFVGDIVHFRTDLAAGQHFAWNFGDGNELDNGTSSENHKYKEARVYTVKVIMDGTCTDIRELVVYQRKQNFDNILLAGPRVDAQQTATTGDNVRFTDTSPSSTLWAWYFDDSPEVYSREREVFYTFKKPGTHKIFLVVNNNPSLTFTDFISVNDRPVVKDPEAKPKETKPPVVIQINKDPTSPPLTPPKDSLEIKPPPPVTTPPVTTPPVATTVTETKKAPPFSDNEWSTALLDVSRGKKTAQDFSTYLCDNLNVPILARDKHDKRAKKYNFKEFCDFIVIKKGQKKIKSITVTPTKNASNCVLSLMIDIERTLLDDW